MTFDWFRRQYNQEAEKAPAEETKPTEPEKAASETPAQDTSQVAEDYLSWAKAAYQNIQKRQQTEETPTQEKPAETTPATPESPPETQPSPAEAIVAQVETPLAPTEEAGEVAPEETEEAVSATAVSESLDSSGDSETATIAPAVEAEKTTAPLPFWAESEADRQARLERLKESAIVEPEPQVSAPVETPIVQPETQPEVPELMLDEGFLWSAEVLASQGRRPDQVSLEEITWLKRLRQGLDKTRRNLVNQLRAIVGQGPLNQDAVMEIEAALLQADVGVDATDAIIEALQNKLRSDVLPPDAAITYLKQILRDMLDAPLNQANYAFAPQKDVLNIWLITGVNGAGKTTTIGKLAHIAQKSGYNCLIAAADTFRAAAVEQVKVWGSRSGVEVIANPGQNTDPAAVVFDAITSAQSRGTELLLVDTAGRLQNKKNLMAELSKIRRIIDKKSDSAVVESLLVLDATLGQNGLKQAQVFSEAAQLSGVVLTKLDGTAKGGIALAVVQQLGLPIRFIGAGEGIEDLRPFSSYEFVEALLSD